MDLPIEVAGLHFRSPLLLASGVVGASALLAKRAVDSGAGGVVTKSIGLKAREGNPGPTVVETPCGLLNSMGLPNPGVEEIVKEVQILKKFDIPVLASIYGFSVQDYVHAATLMVEAGADGVELNLSCPNVEGTGLEVGIDPSQVEEIIETTKAAVKDAVVIAKLTPNITDITVIGKAAEKGGADGVTAINTVKAMAIDIYLERPILSSGVGGLSGTAIHPIAVRAVYELYKKLDIPIIGCGGVISWSDAIEFFLAGASAVQIGTGILYKDFEIFHTVLEGISQYLKKRGVNDIQSLIGNSHKTST